MWMIRCRGLFAAAAAPLAVLAASRPSRQTDCQTEGSIKCNDVTCKRKPQVLISAFNDWRDLGENGKNIFRCRDNPSCRLLLGTPCESPPMDRDGMLCRLLREQMPQVDFTFVTLPVVWNTAAGLHLHPFDVVIHLGLGVYESRTHILVEDGAFNARRGNDAIGQQAGTTIAYGEPQTFYVEKISNVVRELATEAAGYSVGVAPARSSNSYICNETHWRALKAVHCAPTLTGSFLKGAFFVHLPLPNRTQFKNQKYEQEFNSNFADLSDDTDYLPLSQAVACVVQRLIEATLAM